MEACPDHPPASSTAPPSAAATAATLLLGLAVLLLSSWLTNRRFGHATYHRGAPIEDADNNGEEASKPPHSTPPPPRAVPSSPPPTGAGRRWLLLQEALPEELLVDQILPFLTPFEVVTGPALCSRVYWAAAEAPGLWARFARRAGLAELLLVAQAAATRRGETMVERRREGGVGVRQQQQSEDSPSEGMRLAGAAGVEVVKGKLEFFRRAFLLPYTLTKGHGGPQSCRVVVHGAAYDVTSYLGAHPGGEAILLEYGGGVDASTVFELALHSAQARRKMREFLLWDPASPSCLGRRGTILGLLYAATTGGRGLGATSSGRNSGTGVSLATERAIPLPTIPISGTSGGILRANDAHSPPTIVHTLEAVKFGP